MGEVGKDALSIQWVYRGHRLYPRSHKKVVAETLNGLCYSRALPASSSGLGSKVVDENLLKYTCLHNDDDDS